MCCNTHNKHTEARHKRIGEIGLRKAKTTTRNTQDRGYTHSPVLSFNFTWPDVISQAMKVGENIP